MPPGMTIAPVVQPGMRIQSLGEVDAQRNAEIAAQQVAQAEPAPGVEENAGLAALAAIGSGEETVDPAQAELEDKHGQGETFANQAARGALSALLAPGALGGAQIELYGKLLGSKRIEDWGRGMGQAATGRSALEAAHFAAAAFGGEEDATGIADQARIPVDEQEKAWPLLSTAAQATGALALGAATGGMSRGASQLGVKGLAALGAVEGAGAGAQVAYDADAPITDVWTSALMGGAVGGALAGGASAAGKLIGKAKPRGDMQKVFGAEGETLGSFADERVAHSLGFNKRLYKKYGAEKVADVARAVDEAHLADGTPVFPRTAMDAARMDRADIAERLVRAHDEVGKEIGALRARASQWIDQAAPDLRPQPRMIADRIDIEVAKPLLESVSEADRAAGRYVMKTTRNIRELGDDISLEDFVQQRSRIGSETNFNMATPKPQTEAMVKAYGLMNDDLAARFERAAEGMGEAAQFRPLNRKFHLYEVALDAMDDGVAAKMGNNSLGLSSNVVMAGTLAGDIATGGGYSAIKALGAGIGHKLLMEKGPQLLAVLARKFSRTPAAVDVAVAGGREAQDVLTEVTRMRNFVRETGEQAGANPAGRAVAENTAEEVASRELAKRAGQFDPAGWATSAKAPSPLARVFYRTEILDNVSKDLSAAVERSVAMRPALDFDLDAGKLARLTKSADGPEAIGALQAKVRELADAVPEGDQAKPAFEALIHRLETADVPGAMTEGHALVRGLSQMGDDMGARSIALTLGDDVFGDAGRLYRQTIGAPDDILREMGDPAKLRESLRTLELRGQLSQQIATEHRATLAAYEARQKLAGEAMPDGLKKQMRDIEALWSKGEEHVTLDGARFGRVVDALENMVEQKVASKVPRGTPDQQVIETIKRAVTHIEPALKPALRARRGRVGRAVAGGILTGAARLQQYEKRLDQLSQAVVQPDTETRTAGINTAPPELRTTLVSTMDSKLATLQKDMPKPTSSIHGTSMSSLSSEDIRRGNAMWEATMEPLSVFEDFARGDVDPDKVAYAWKQYPGLQKTAQMGVIDMLMTQMSDDERSAVPDATLTQLDYLLGFNGALQGTLEFSFSQRMTAVGEQAKQAQGATPPAPSRGLQLPTSQPSLTERLAGSR